MSCYDHAASLVWMQQSLSVTSWNKLMSDTHIVRLMIG